MSLVVAATIGRGMGPVAQLEIGNRLGGLVSTLELWEGKAFIHFGSHVSSIPLQIFDLKSVERIFLCIYHGPIPDSLKESLEQPATNVCLEKVCEFVGHQFPRLPVASQTCRAAIENYRIERSTPHESLRAPTVESAPTRRESSSWRVKCRGLWRRVAPNDLSLMLSRASEPREGIPPMQEVCLQLSDAGVFIGLPLTERTLSLRPYYAQSVSSSSQGVAGVEAKQRSGIGGGAEGAAALRPRVRSTIAYAMGLYCQIGSTVGESVLDPMCGTGAILLEAMYEWPDSFYIGTDHSPSQLQAAQATFLSASEADGGRRRGLVELVRCDVRAPFPFRKGAFSRVVGDLPFGRQHDLVKPVFLKDEQPSGSHTTNLGEGRRGWEMVRALLDALSRVVCLGGRAVLLSMQAHTLDPEASRWKAHHKESGSLDHGSAQGARCILEVDIGLLVGSGTPQLVEKRKRKAECVPPVAQRCSLQESVHGRTAAEQESAVQCLEAAEQLKVPEAAGQLGESVQCLEAAEQLGDWRVAGRQAVQLGSLNGAGLLLLVKDR